jgi:hypothetical protein
MAWAVTLQGVAGEWMGKLVDATFEGEGSGLRDREAWTSKVVGL